MLKEDVVVRDVLKAHTCKRIGHIEENYFSLHDFSNNTFSNEEY